MILNFSVAIFLFSLVAFFSVGDPKKLQCADAITPSTQDTNTLCAVQGAILMFASLATAMWCCALIINVIKKIIYIYMIDIDFLFIYL